MPKVTIELPDLDPIQTLDAGDAVSRGVMRADSQESLLATYAQVGANAEIATQLAEWNGIRLGSERAALVTMFNAGDPAVVAMASAKHAEILAAEAKAKADAAALAEVNHQ